MSKPVPTCNSRETNFTEQGNCSPDDLDSYAFEADRPASAHPIRLAATKDTIYDRDTGEIVARVEPGYEIYWAHWHPHICPEGWRGEVA